MHPTIGAKWLAVIAVCAVLAGIASALAGDRGVAAPGAEKLSHGRAGLGVVTWQGQNAQERVFKTGTAVAAHHATTDGLGTDSATMGSPPPAEPTDVIRKKYPNAAIVTINSEISDVTAESIERRVEHARKAGAQLIVFELDTPGGMVTSALDICDYIKNLTDVKTVAWVNTQAYSAGSMIALACDEIVMSPRSSIGDCGVILGGPTGPAAVPEELRAKAESPVIEQFRDSATRNGYNRLLCEAMVVKERVVYWIENKETGERRFVDAQDKLRLVGGDEESSPFAPAGGEPSEEASDHQWRLVTSYVDPVTGKKAEIGEPVVSENELLTMSQSLAMAFGFSKAVVANVGELEARYGISGKPLQLDFSWSERFTSWLTSMPVRMFLLLIVFLGAYVEFNTPGVGVPGLVALICLGIFVGAPYLTGLANVWEIVLILIGFALIGLEIFVIPGFGIAGISGILCVLVGLLATFVPNEPGREFPIYWPHFEYGLRGLRYGAITIGVAFAASIVGMALISRVLPKIRWLHGVIPENPQAVAVTMDDPYRGHARVGDRGKVESALRPAGKARFENMLVDVVTEGELIDPPAEVEVIERRGNRVVVRRVS